MTVLSLSMTTDAQCESASIASTPPGTQLRNRMLPWSEAWITTAVPPRYLRSDGSAPGQFGSVITSIFSAC